MNRIFLIFIIAFVCSGCNKNNTQVVSGTIGGKPAITLYGSSKAPADYLFLSTAQKEISYNGQVLSYVYGPSKTIFLIRAGATAGKCTLDTAALPIELYIDTTFSITFGSPTYTAK